VVTALYRRYRPETFAEMIGQSQVTEPLMTALRTNRVNHAYLFSGPRGCGKTTSARILARCLNCAQGPTDTPCGECESCIELGRGGQGSLDVVEIDAASHNGVDDARDIRERAIFAPARDRYKIFILDEAHMVTPQGFNALLKIVEEPPEHVKFIFATTEPDKVIGTIRSRTHHYPFRLVPPAQMLDYVQQMCDHEGMTVAPGVLPLVVRAGGGSPRDTLSLLDQLIAGSEGDSIEYERAVALLGYTHAALLDEVVDAIAAVDAATAFAAVDRVIQTGQDPRRFVEDLLERLRDLIIVAATSPEAAAAVLRGTPQEELDRMSVQATSFGAADLSRCADIVNAALTEMTGATSPRLHLELMIARMLVPASDATDRGALARVERLERRVGVEVPVDPAGAAAPAAAMPTSPASASLRPASPPAPAHTASSDAAGSSSSVGAPAASPGTSPAPASSAPASPVPASPVPASSAPASSGLAPAADSGAESTADPAVAQAAAFAAAAAAKKGGASATGASGGSQASGWATPGVTDEAPAAPVGPVTTQQVRDAWPEILDAVAELSRNAWAVVYTATVRSLDGDVLALSFPSANDVESFRGRPGAKDAASEVLRNAIVDLLGVRVKFLAKPAGSEGGAGGAAPGGPAAGGPVAGGPGRAGPTGPGGGSARQGDADRMQDGPGGSVSRPEARPSGGGTSATPQERDRSAAPSPANSAGRLTGSPSSRSSSSSGGAPSTGSSSAPSSSAGSAAVPSSGVSWATVAIPGSSATAVLERPESEPAGDVRVEPETARVESDPARVESDSATPTVLAPAAASSTEAGARGGATDGRTAAGATDGRTAAGGSTEPAPGMRELTDADAPDDDEPPYPDDDADDAAPRSTAAPVSNRAFTAPGPGAPAGTVQAAPSADIPSPDIPNGAAPGTSPRGAKASEAPARPKTSVGFREPSRYGEAVVRELLGAKFIEEQEVEPRQGGSAQGSPSQGGWAR